MLIKATMNNMQTKVLKRGIYLVANKKSSDECHNLIYSIRKSGCSLPIHVIPYGGEPPTIPSAAGEVKLLSMSDFSAEGLAFLEQVERRMPQCSPGLLRRFLAWFGDFDEFLYSDNDIVALMNWEKLFSYLEENEIVHADTEYRTGGRFNLSQPDRFKELLGPDALESAITAGHFLCRRSPRHVNDLLAGLAWMEAHTDVPKWHDQALLHITLELAKWPTLNLCKPPHNWACTWAGSYGNVLDIFRVIQVDGHPISHLHYSGGIATGTQPIDELLFSKLSAKERRRELFGALMCEFSGLSAVQRLVPRAISKAKRKMRSKR